MIFCSTYDFLLHLSICWKKLYYNYDEINDVIFRYKLEQEGLNLDYGEATNEEILNRLMTVLS